MRILARTSLYTMVLTAIPTLGAGRLLLFTRPQRSGITTANLSDQNSAITNLKIEARLGNKSFALGERAQLVLWITNRGKELVTVNDPRRGGDSLRLWLRPPSGEERSFTTGEALRAPGVKQIAVGMRLPPGVRQNFEFDLAKLTDLSEPGRYVLRLEYTWQSGKQAWHSTEMPFSITAARRRAAEPLVNENGS